MSKILLAGATLALALPPTARADLITWGPIQNATGPTEVSLNGTTVAARNVWHTTSTSPVVNGVTFAAFAPSGWTQGTNVALNGSTSGDAGYDQLMVDARATNEPTPLTNPTGWGGIRIDNLGTLTLGNCYEIQVWYGDNRPGTGTALNDRVMTLSSATGAALIGTTGIVSNLGSLTQGALSGGLEADPNNLSGAGDTIFGSYCIGTFTRTSADQIWLLVQGSHPILANTLRPHVNGFQIRELSCNTPSTPFCDGSVPGACAGCVPANTGAPGSGCANSAFPGGTLLSASGLASLASDTLVLTTTDMPGPGLFFQANGLGSVNPFGDGMLCAAVGIVRMGVVFPSPTFTASYPGGLTPAPISVAGAPISAGDLKHYQVWYRDSAAFCSTSTFNTSNGVSLTWAP